MSCDDFGTVVDRIYEAAVRPQLWSTVLHEVAERAGAFGAQMLHHRPEGAVLHAASPTLKPVLEAFFAEGWHRNNPREVRARRRGTDHRRVVTDRDLFTKEELDREPWQRDFLDRYGLRWFCTLSLRPVIELAPFMMTLERLAAHDPFSDVEVATIEASLPHIQRAIAITTALGAASQSGMMDAFTAVKQPAVLLDDLCQVVRLNPAAEALLGDGVQVIRGRLHGSSRAGDAALQRLIASVCWSGAASRAPAVDAVALPRIDGRPLIAQATPLVDSARDLFQQGRALVLFKDMTKAEPPDAGLLKALFGLTSAEARIAQFLSGGRGLSVAASEFEISLSTVRTHLKAIFTKTDTHNQSELAVLLARTGHPLAS